MRILIRNEWHETVEYVPQFPVLAPETKYYMLRKGKMGDIVSESMRYKLPGRRWESLHTNNPQNIRL